MDLRCLCTMVLLVTPTEVELSVWVGVLVWGNPISIRNCQMGIITLSMMKKLESSDSAAEDMKNLLIWIMVSMYQLSQVTGSF